MDPQPLARKVAIVTGSASGIGKGIALRFAEEGADVSCWDLNLEGAKETAREVEKAGGNLWLSRWMLLKVEK